MSRMYEKNTYIDGRILSFFFAFPLSSIQGRWFFFQAIPYFFSFELSSSIYLSRHSSLMTVSKRGSLVFAKRNLLNCIYLKQIIPFIFFLSTINQIQCKEKKNITTNTSVYIHMYEKIYDYIFGLTPSSSYIYVTTCIIYLCKKKKERNIFMWSYAVNWSLSLFQKPINLNRY